MSTSLLTRLEELYEEYAHCTDDARIEVILREMAVLEMATISLSEPVVPAEWEG